MKKALAYTRVSSHEQLERGFSIPAQRDRLAAYAQEKGLRVVAEFSDDETAKTEGRPGFAAMLRYLQEHGAVRLVLVEKTDRLYRNLKDWITLEELGVELHLVAEGTVISPESHSSARFLHGIKVLMAKNYVENLSEEVKKGMRKKAAGGAYPSAAPLGYVNVAQKELGIAPDPVAGPIVRDLFEQAATGKYSLRRLTALARSQGLRSMKGHRVGHFTIRRILSNPVYMGQFRWAGVDYEGRYDPLVSRALFAQVQAALSENKPKEQVHTFAYNGLAVCAGCRRHFCGDLKKQRYVYYHCNGEKGTCGRPYVREELFDAKAVEILESLRLDQALSDFIREELRAWHRDGSQRNAERAARLKARATELRRLRLAAYEEKLSGKIDEAFYVERLAAWQRELDGISLELDRLAPAESEEGFLVSALSPIELLQVAPALYLRQEPEKKRDLLRTVVSNFVYRDGSLSASLRSPFDVLAGIRCREDWRGRRGSNPHARRPSVAQARFARRGALETSCGGGGPPHPPGRGS